MTPKPPSPLRSQESFKTAKPAESRIAYDWPEAFLAAFQGAIEGVARWNPSGQLVPLLTWILKGRKLSASVDLDRPASRLGGRGGELVVVREAVFGVEYEVAVLNEMTCVRSEMSRSKSWLRAAAYLPIYLLCIAPAALLWQRPVTLALVYAIASVGLLIWRHSTADLVYFFVPFFLGPAGEFFAVQQGAWSYPEGRVLPIWLPFVWGIAGLFMKNVSETLSRKGASGSSDEVAIVPFSEERFRSLVARVITLGVAIWVMFLLTFMGYHLLVPSPMPEGWLLSLIHQRYAALIQVPVLALAAFCGVLLFGVVSGEAIEFKVIGLEFRGAAGPVVLTVFSLLALVLATYLLWDVK